MWLVQWIAPLIYSHILYMIEEVHYISPFDHILAKVNSVWIMTIRKISYKLIYLKLQLVHSSELRIWQETRSRNIATSRRQWEDGSTCPLSWWRMHIPAFLMKMSWARTILSTGMLWDSQQKNQNGKREVWKKPSSSRRQGCVPLPAMGGATIFPRCSWSCYVARLTFVAYS